MSVSFSIWNVHRGVLARNRQSESAPTAEKAREASLCSKSAGPPSGQRSATNRSHSEVAATGCWCRIRRNTRLLIRESY